MKIPLTISDVQEWIEETKDQYDPLIDSSNLSLSDDESDIYWDLKRLMEYYAHRQECERALNELVCYAGDFDQIVAWTNKYKELGKDKFLMFELDFSEWWEDSDGQHLKIRDGLYVEGAPFNKLSWFCAVFYFLFWTCRVTEISFSTIDQQLLCEELSSMLQEYDLKH